MGDAAGALQPHFPQRTVKVLDVGKANAFDALALYQRPDAHEVCTLTLREVPQLFGSGSSELDGPHAD
jgi:hypothetical protein